MLRAVPLANAAAILASAFYLLCALLVAIAPGGFVAIVQSWFHGVQFTSVGGPALTAPQFLLGIITLAATAWVSAALLAALYDRLGGGPRSMGGDR